MTDGGHVGDREQFWRDHVAGWKSSGLSLRLYSEEHGLKAGTLGYWNSRRRVARIHKIFADETQPKQCVRLQMILRRSLDWAKSQRTYRILSLYASYSHFNLLIHLDNIHATRCRDLPTATDCAALADRIDALIRPA